MPSDYTPQEWATGDTFTPEQATAISAQLNEEEGINTAQEAAISGKQASDSDLTAIAGLSPANDDVIQRKSGAWTNRTPAQLKTDLSLAKGDVGLGNVDNTADTAKPVSTAQQTALNLKANLASPTFTGTVAGITKTMVGLGSVDNTADTAKPVSTAQQTALDLKAPLASPTFTGTVSGVTKAHVGLGSVDNTADTAKAVASAAALTTSRNIDGQAFNGTANITVIAPGTHAATGKTTPVAADEIPLVDSAASNVLKKLTWANLVTAVGGSTSLVFNVKSYGAVGDGTTDDTTAIQAAIDAAAAANGGIVFFPQAVYKVTSLNLKNYVHLKGVGNGYTWNDATPRKGSVIKTAATSGDMLAFSPGGGDGFQGVSIEGLRLEGPGTGTGNGIRVQSSSTAETGITLRDLYVEKFGGCGIEIQCLIVSTLENVFAVDCGTGFFLNGGVAYANTNTSTTLSACFALRCTTYGYHLLSSTYCVLDGTAADNCGTAYFIETCASITLNSPGAEWWAADTSSPGDGFVISDCKAIVLNAPRTVGNIRYSYWIKNSSTRVVMIAPGESTPAASVNSLKTESGTQTTLICSDLIFTPLSVSAGTVTYIDVGGLTLTGPKIDTLKDSNGVQALRLAATAAAVCNFAVANAVTGDWPKLVAESSVDTNVGIQLITQGSAAVQQYVGSQTKATWAVNGSQTNIDQDVTSKGTGVVKANGVEVVTLTGTQTQTNKRITQRIGTVTSSATPTINTDNVDQFNITALAAAITSFTTNLSGTPTDGQCLDVRIKGDATPRAIAWGASFTGTLLTTTVASKTHLQRLKWDAAAAKWAGYLADASGY